MMMWEMLTGQAPWHGMGDTAVLASVGAPQRLMILHLLQLPLLRCSIMGFLVWRVQVIGRRRPPLPRAGGGAAAALDGGSHKDDDDVIEEDGSRSLLHASPRGSDDVVTSLSLHAAAPDRQPGHTLSPQSSAAATTPVARSTHLPLAQQPASLHVLPELNDIIRACWQQRDLRRPTAETVHTQVQALLQQHTGAVSPGKKGL
jgi:hypothetical protein